MDGGKCWNSTKYLFLKEHRSDFFSMVLVHDGEGNGNPLLPGKSDSITKSCNIFHNLINVQSPKFCQYVRKDDINLVNEVSSVVNDITNNNYIKCLDYN